jgi:hypothetical protein
MKRLHRVNMDILDMVATKPMFHGSSPLPQNTFALDDELVRAGYTNMPNRKLKASFLQRRPGGIIHVHRFGPEVADDNTY